ncbi:hypothetical protein HOLleu_09490 [Holothuria leucospilota]|uniref:Uncharacterized protein n=1 Tax=Holothuria leucospilota TaxID=206669 RepID=A0A9Q1HEZ9_HOLLE|nr:hypothetical protein HOLleu_09490 [Holothuria leucospilota]
MDYYTLQDDSDGEPEQDGVSSSSDSCKDCPICCYKVLLNLNLLTDAYKSIGLTYELLLTLTVWQVKWHVNFLLCLEENKKPFEKYNDTRTT